MKPVAAKPAPKEWVLKAKALLEEKAFDGPWPRLVEQWYRREESKSFVSPVSFLHARYREGKLTVTGQPKGHPAKLRPAQVGAWVQRARQRTLDIQDVEAFGKTWTDWWRDINPPWRKAITPMPRTDGDWVLLDLPGPNGFLNVLVCLKWWRERLEQESPVWREGVEDVLWVLERMNG
ncbi:hypothetical protein B0H14DRAFT_2402747 [Mycena olivaceomarginata]|nr:hypothetical protein B0H14DRAFT_2402747 [Mycena olivaceomarginata]